jgi:hypothetical protein
MQRLLVALVQRIANSCERSQVYSVIAIEEAIVHRTTPCFLRDNVPGRFFRAALRLMVPSFMVACALIAGSAAAQVEVKAISLRLSGKEVPLAAGVRLSVAALAREMMSRCGPNTRQHPQNFGDGAADTDSRWTGTLAGSRLHIVFAAPFETVSHLGGKLPVSEVVIGFEQRQLFVGPEFSRHEGALAEHLSCEYLPALELACLAELETHMPPHYRATCRRLDRGADGRIVMPPPDIAPSCS